MFEEITLDELAAVLSETPAVDLKALALMRQATVKPGQIMPRGLSRDTYLDAVGEWTEYINLCTATAERLVKAIPTIEAAFPIGEYPL